MDVLHNEQVRCVNSIYMGLLQVTNYSRYIDCIKKKMYSYSKQDKIKKRKNNMTFDTIIELLVASKLQCFYCKDYIYLIYTNDKREKQWSLDRIDNNNGHTHDNCVISCLSCNIQKRRRSHHYFRLGKQMRINKIK